MKINGPTDTNRLDTLRPTGNKATTATAAGAPATGPEPAPAATSGPVRVTVPNVQPFDAAKVERIKEAIRNGEFQVDSAMVAHKLMTSVNELFGRRH